MQTASGKATPRRASPFASNVKTLRATLENIPRRTLVFWMIAAALGLFMLPVTLLASSLTERVTTLNTDMQAAVQAQTQMPTLKPEVQALNKKLQQLQLQAGAAKALQPTLDAGNLAWTNVMAAVGNYDASQIAIDGLVRAEQRLVLTGRATSDQAILDYVSTLQRSNAFNSVVLQSVQIADSQAVTMTVAPGLISPTATLSPTMTVTPTPNLRDAYEPDEVIAPYYYLGQTQIHTFYPVNDIDQVVFLAKAGRYYRIATQNLSPGVDTVLQINVGGKILENDDAKPGSLYSEIVLSNLPSDTTITITITNRGQYGMTSAYTLVVEEIIPTVTPTGQSATSQPLTTAGTTSVEKNPVGTAAPTSTSVPATNTPVPATSTSVPPTSTTPPTATPTATITSQPTATATATFTALTPTETPSPTSTQAVPTATETATPAFTIRNAVLNFAPPQNNQCPVTFIFNGAITTSGDGTLSYYLERNDGTMTALQTVAVTGEYTTLVADTWTIPGAPGFNFTGWERIHITAPYESVSNPVNIQLFCAPDLIPTPAALQFKNTRDTWLSRALTGSNLLGAAVHALASCRNILPVFNTTRAALPNSAPAIAPGAAAMPLRFVIVLEPKATKP